MSDDYGYLHALMTPESAKKVLDEIVRGVFTSYNTEMVRIKDKTSALALATFILIDEKKEAEH